jgi:hypothetical protein
MEMIATAVSREQPSGITLWIAVAGPGVIEFDLIPVWYVSQIEIIIIYSTM